MNEKNITVSLPPEKWNIIMNALGQRPYVEVADLIFQIKKQADEQAAQTMQQEKVP
jgi:hypothetical protein